MSQIAFKASLILSLSVPPAWAKSFLPPPPLPPSISEAILTNSTASYFETRFLVTPTARPTFSSKEEIQITIPSLISFLP